MVDVHNPDSRQKNMVAIRNRNTGPERYIRRLLVEAGFKYRTNVAALPGKPDIVVTRHNAVILVNGCFWHKHDCHLFKLPDTRQAFWLEKLSRSAQRDQEKIAALNQLGWRVLVVWECALKGKQRLQKAGLMERLEEWILRGNANAAIDTKGIHLL